MNKCFSLSTCLVRTFPLSPGQPLTHMTWSRTNSGTPEGLQVSLHSHRDLQEFFLKLSREIISTNNPQISMMCDTTQIHQYNAANPDYFFFLFKYLEERNLFFHLPPILPLWWVLAEKLKTRVEINGTAIKLSILFRSFECSEVTLFSSPSPLLSPTAKEISRGCHSNTRQGHCGARHACSAMCTSGSGRLHPRN